MAWQEVIGQGRVADVLRRTLASGRVAHAYLFHGPDGVGKRAMALELAKALQCERGGDEACGRCLACTKVNRLIHPDVHVLFPTPSDVDADDIAERIRRLAENPYAAIDYMRRPSLSDPSKTSNKQAIYSIDRVNDELRRTMSYRPVEGRYKVTIMTDADKLRVEAANAFLKLLEEPTAHTLFILTTSQPDRLLPTIVSRCQPLRFDILTPDAIETALKERGDAPADLAPTLARMADGSYTRALDLAENDDLMDGRAKVLDFFRAAYACHINRLSDLIEEISKMGRERIKGVLDLMLRWMRDLVLYRMLGNEAPLVNVDQAGSIAQFCENVPQADLEAMVARVEEALDLIERNVQPSLVLTTLAHALGRAMLGRSGQSLFVPLADLGTPVEVV